jgi:glycerate dehydrogenase
MDIVVLDGFTLNPGDLSWDKLKALGNVTIYDRTGPEQVMDRIGNAEIVLTNKTVLSEETILKLNHVRYIGVLATGYDVVHVKTAIQQGIIVCNVPSYGTKSVAQMTIALLLELCNHVQIHHDAVQKGEWSSNLDFCFTKTPLIELDSKTMGIIGLGTIGKQVAKIALALGMSVLAVNRGNQSHHPGAAIQFTTLDRVLREADVITLHCPLSPETKGFINEASIALMKKSAYLINTSRGGLIVEQDLADALNEERIAGAALDVLSIEPPSVGNPLFSAKNCLITPHISWATREARTRLMEIAVDNVKAFVENQPRNTISIT